MGRRHFSGQKNSQLVASEEKAYMKSNLFSNMESSCLSISIRGYQQRFFTHTYKRPWQSRESPDP